ncbi:unnamed protein product [Timema podura]|uniref:Uncharacterized protein n=1 Tax=Timema podura TaxID=61482 RepID=A0ABN7NLY6_TIMPD|nr:unnamed protein product [Timema podura]
MTLENIGWEENSSMIGNVKIWRRKLPNIGKMKTWKSSHECQRGARRSIELNAHFPLSSGWTRHGRWAREQYLFNVFEVIVSTLESKLQRIDNLDKAVEHLMRRVEMLDSRVTDNIDKTDSVINKLSNLDLKLFHQDDILDSNVAGTIGGIRMTIPLETTSGAHVDTLDMRLVSLDQKVSDIDNKLVGLKNTLDTNFLPADDINAEASEKKPISMNVVDITKVLNAELMNHVSREFDGLRAATGDVDKKLQFHINIVSDNLEKVLDMVSDVHDAVVEPEQEAASMPQPFRNRTMSTTTPLPIVKSSKLDKLVRQMHPILSVSEKMDEVWDVVVGTKSSVDDLVPKSDELLTQTQRQERAINDIHADLRTKANKIIANLDMRPVPAELLLDPTIDRLVEYDVNRYTEPISQEEMVTMTETPPPITFTTPITTQQQITQSTFFSNSGVVNTLPPSTSAPATAPGGSSRVSSRNRGVIFPSVKNKPSLANSTFTTDLIATIKDVKISKEFIYFPLRLNSPRLEDLGILTKLMVCGGGRYNLEEQYPHLREVKKQFKEKHPQYIYWPGFKPQPPYPQETRIVCSVFKNRILPAPSGSLQ